MLSLEVRLVNIGENLKKIRKAKGLSLETVANALDIGVSTLSEYESNKTEPSLSRYFSLLDFYNVDPMYFLLKGEEYIRITTYSESRKRKAYALDASERKNKI